MEVQTKEEGEMVALREIERQLKAIGVTTHFWGRPEVLELQYILIPGEVIHGFSNGWYEGGFASLVVTDQRILLVDKKIFHLTVEDLRYDMVSEVDFSSQVFNGKVQICTPTKKLGFTSFKPTQLRDLASFIQQRVIEIRQQFGGQTSEQQPAVMVQQAQSLAESPQPPQAPFIDPRYPQTEQPTPVASAASPIAQQLAQPSTSGNRLPLPGIARNPYASTPVMMRRKIGRFGTLGQAAIR